MDPNSADKFKKKYPDKIKLKLNRPLDFLIALPTVSTIRGQNGSVILGYGSDNNPFRQLLERVHSHIVSGKRKFRNDNLEDFKEIGEKLKIFEQTFNRTIEVALRCNLPIAKPLDSLKREYDKFKKDFSVPHHQENQIHPTSPLQEIIHLLKVQGFEIKKSDRSYRATKDTIVRSFKSAGIPNLTAKEEELLLKRIQNVVENHF